MGWSTLSTYDSMCLTVMLSLRFSQRLNGEVGDVHCVSQKEYHSEEGVQSYKLKNEAVG